MFTNLVTELFESMSSQWNEFVARLTDLIDCSSLLFIIFDTVETRAVKTPIFGVA